MIIKAVRENHKDCEELSRDMEHSQDLLLSPLTASPDIIVYNKAFLATG